MSRLWQAPGLERRGGGASFSRMQDHGEEKGASRVQKPRRSVPSARFMARRTARPRARSRMGPMAVVAAEGGAVPESNLADDHITMAKTTSKPSDTPGQAI